MARPRKHGEKLASIPISLTWDQVDLICGPSAGQSLGHPWRKQIAAAALAGARALKLDRVLGAEGVALIDNPQGWRLEIQASPKHLNTLRAALVWFEDLFIKGANNMADHATPIRNPFLETRISEGFIRDLTNLRAFTLAQGQTITEIATPDGVARIEFITNEAE